MRDTKNRPVVTQAAAQNALELLIPEPIKGTGVMNCISLHRITQKQRIIAQLTITSVGHTVVIAIKGKGVRCLHKTCSTVVDISKNIAHCHLRRICCYSIKTDGVLVLSFRSAAIPTIESSDEFIPAIGLAAIAFKSSQTNAIAIITGTAIEAGNIIAMILGTGRVSNSKEKAHSNECGQQHIAQNFHKQSFESAKVAKFGSKINNRLRTCRKVLQAGEYSLT